MPAALTFATNDSSTVRLTWLEANLSLIGILPMAAPSAVSRFITPHIRWKLDRTEFPSGALRIIIGRSGTARATSTETVLPILVRSGSTIVATGSRLGGVGPGALPAPFEM